MPEEHFTDIGCFLEADQSKAEYGGHSLHCLPTPTDRSHSNHKWVQCRARLQGELSYLASKWKQHKYCGGTGWKATSCFYQFFRI